MRSEWELLGRLALVLVLSTVIGLERELREKSAEAANLARAEDGGTASG